MQANLRLINGVKIRIPSKLNWREANGSCRFMLTHDSHLNDSQLYPTTGSRQQKQRKKAKYVTFLASPSSFNYNSNEPVEEREAGRGRELSFVEGKVADLAAPSLAAADQLGALSLTAPAANDWTRGGKKLSKPGGSSIRHCQPQASRSLHTLVAPRAPIGGAGSKRLILGRHVTEALANGSPIVALESTVITHGLPEPQNLELALELERIVRKGSSSSCSCDNDKQFEGAVPATIGIIKGQLVVGLTGDEIEHLAKGANKSEKRACGQLKDIQPIIKASRRDLPIAMGLKQSAGTTVSATMAIACSLPGKPIKVFATGGTGGVHMGGESSMDISADLYEFARSPIGIVSSGFKSFLDLRRSLEFLETMGCTVMSLRAKDCDETLAASEQEQQLSSSSDLFPGFFSSFNELGIKSPCLVESIEDAARILFYSLEGPLEQQRASLLAIPIPSEFSLTMKQLTSDTTGMDNKLSDWLANIAKEVDGRSDVEGKEKTPLILEHLNQVSGGKTLRANMELLKSNAQHGARLAIEYARLRSRTSIKGPNSSINSQRDTNDEHHERLTPEGRELEKQRGTITGSRRKQTTTNTSSAAANNTASSQVEEEQFGPVVVGCTMIDMHVSTEVDARFKANPRHSGITFEGRPHLALGGVGRNLATAIELMGHKPTFISSLARDNLGSFALQELEKCGIAGDRLKLSWFESGFSAASASTSASIKTTKVSSSCFALVLMDSLEGQCEYVIANLEAAKRICGTTIIEANKRQLNRAPLLVMDANLSQQTMEQLIEYCYKFEVPIFIEPTDFMALKTLVASFKSMKSNLDKAQCLSSLLCLSPNLVELKGLMELFEVSDESNSVENCKPQGQAMSDGDDLLEIERMIVRLMKIHLPELKCLLVTLDKRGVLVAIRYDNVDDEIAIENAKLLTGQRKRQQNNIGTSKIHMKHFKPPQLIERPVSASGAGDSFAAGFISGLLRNWSLIECVDLGFRAALLALQDRDTISKRLRELSGVQN